jgi:hypothetical protein
MSSSSGPRGADRCPDARADVECACWRFRFRAVTSRTKPSLTCSGKKRIPAHFFLTVCLTTVPRRPLQCWTATCNRPRTLWGPRFLTFLLVWFVFSMISVMCDCLRGPNTSQRRGVVNVAWDMTPKRWIRTQDQEEVLSTFFYIPVSVNGSICSGLGHGIKRECFVFLTLLHP